MSAGENNSNQAEALTSGNLDRQCYQGRNRVTKQRHLPTREQGTSKVTWGKATKQRHSQSGQQRTRNVS